MEIINGPEAEPDSVPSTHISISWTLTNFRMYSLNQSSQFAMKIGSMPSDNLTAQLWIRPHQLQSNTFFNYDYTVGLNLGRIVDNKISPVTHDILGEDITFTIRDGDNEVVACQSVLCLPGSTTRASEEFGLDPFEGPIKCLTINCEVEIFLTRRELRRRDLETKVINDFSHLLDSSILSDCVLCVGEHKFPFACHKAILAAKSPVFAAMFTVDMQERETHEVRIVDFEPEVIKHMLSFIYGGSLQVSGLDLDSTMSLLPAADKYCLDDLKDLCEDALVDQISDENCLELLQLGDVFRASRLKNSALRYICDRVLILANQEDWQERLREHPKECLQILVAKSKCLGRQIILIKD